MQKGRYNSSFHGVGSDTIVVFIDVVIIDVIVVVTAFAIVLLL